jgi:dTDP-4-dehydrorhamnose 3,5-epimerase
MKFIPTDHPEVLRIQPRVFTDNRGFFLEAYQKEVFENAGIHFEFVQDNLSSSIKSTLRGLHYQVKHVQGKLIRVVRGEVFDVAVDLRRNSSHFGRWIGIVLSETNKESLWVPPGFAHGFYVLSDWADILYKATDFYDQEGERCLKWDDPDLGITWPIPPGETPILSIKDAEGASFAEAEVL